VHQVKLIKRGSNFILKDFSNELEMEIDFVKQIKSIRARKLAGENLLKAIGKKNKNIKIYDLTAGLGRDALILALAGYEVVMVENNHLIFTMLDAAYKKLIEEDKMLAQRISLVKEDNYNFVSRLSVGENILFYLDPMFPDRIKSAQVKKEMQIMQKICDKTNNLEKLLNLCLTRANVVVKRPKFSKEKLNLIPHHVIKGNKINFMVFKS
jgi:16S rRNA (guanine1516-N2)-methyltransferase